ncbi:hypothetical protein [Flammeovirga kamogawensis]|uniref:Four helix bundle protein n=1 Tax=Flammeovirga kamogawensis TaxID=373891 RepID=A0ABX8GRH7_9BACT|nr:hypothetical protein [Flammeovirga kamogawensis]MBB6462719.1 hypothetical protein [Flammeovirga kamogawensis]QWG06048.1 hypothetical protein KM029_11815 [Flammeovirga kamogawensis]TRX67880.1 hypothetical protein EO216_06835 [Flammeovirga kamogawensis]
MKEVIESLWKNELKRDFPEHTNTIEHLFDSIDTIIDLARDYYLCKHQIKVLNKETKGDLIEEYKDTLQELHEELDYFIRKYSIKIHKNLSK